MNWIILLFALEFGYAPAYGSLNVMPENKELGITRHIGYVMFEAEVVIWDTLFISGITKTYIQRTNDIINYYPFESDYLFNAGLRFGQLELGWKHFCLHPVRPTEIYFQPLTSTDSTYDEFYIRISNK